MDIKRLNADLANLGIRDKDYQSICQHESNQAKNQQDKEMENTMKVLTKVKGNMVVLMQTVKTIAFKYGEAMWRHF